MFKISLSAGHAGFGVTPGKRLPDGSMYEWDFNSAVVAKMMELFSHYQNTAVLRLDDPAGRRDIPLKERADRSNAWGANYHLDVHANAFGSGWNDAHGIETYSYKLSGDSFLIGQKLQKALIAGTGLADRGVKDASENGASFYMICNTKAPANLCECGFMTNGKEAALLKSDAYRTIVARALVGAIVGHFNLIKNPDPVPVVPKTLYRVQVGAFANHDNAVNLQKQLKEKGFDSIIVEP
jgi:N-acetylmuramoyl-L-alanine amidase